MTLLDMAEEVKPTIDALHVPHSEAIEHNVRRFGFEYEMFPSGYRSRRGAPEQQYVENCDCDLCIAARQREEEDDVPAPPTRLTVQELIDRAHKAQLISSRQKCGYHCHCRQCAHNRDFPLLTAQEDGSCSVEFVSKILDLDNFDDDRDGIDQWIDVMQTWKHDGGWMPDGVVSNGNHVHVSKRGDETRFADVQIIIAPQHINALYAVFDWVDVADGGCGQIRGYNRKPGLDSGGSWVGDRGYGTLEHRLWNTPSDPERLWGHLGLSLAITRWAFALTVAMPKFSFTSPNPDSDSRITDQTFEVMHQNLGDIIEGISSYIPGEPCFDMARQLILNLR